VSDSRLVTFVNCHLQGNYMYRGKVKGKSGHIDKDMAGLLLAASFLVAKALLSQ
jgi:hypothetical protein